MIGISLLTLVPRVFGGSAVYASELIRALARVGELDYRVFVPTLAPDAGDGLPSTTVRGYRARSSIPGRAAAMTRASLSPRVRRELELDRLRAIHFPLTVMVPRVERPPSVTTVHDVLHLVHPRFFSPLELSYRKLVYRRLERASRLVIVPSEHGKEVLAERTPIEPGRIRVIPHGVDHRRFRPEERRLREPLLVYPADGYRHKNHERLLKAFALVRGERPELRLLLIGRDLERLGTPPGVELRARVSPDELVELYRSAGALVFPSLHEIFGLPPLEAMACGCPVAAARSGSLSEVCGDAVRYFDPTSVEEIAAAVLDVVEHPELGEAGPARAAHFSWETCARAHEEVYRQLLEAAAPGPPRP
jgi:glycosyltransferase involved in cell wall biosynthesis